MSGQPENAARYCVQYLDLMFSQDGLVPPFNGEATDILSQPRILRLKVKQWRNSQGFYRQTCYHSLLTQQQLTTWSKDALKNPAFIADEVDTGMLKRIEATIDIDIITWKLRALVTEIKIQSCSSAWLRKCCVNFLMTCNGSVPFQLAQMKFGEGKVPVLYINGTFLERGIPIRQAYCKCNQYSTQHNIWGHTRCYTQHTIYDFNSDCNIVSDDFVRLCFILTHAFDLALGCVN
jgi:hypothetical protein